MTATLENGKRMDVEFAQKAIPLLKEYASKLGDWYVEGRELLSSGSRDHTAREELTRRINYIKAPAEDLARQVSAVLEEGRLRGLDRVELWLRHSEFESMLLGVTQLLPYFATSKKS